MKKVVTINLNGHAYQVDEDAYELLRAYLEQAGLTLRDNVSTLRPKIRTLLMSGYSGDVISQYGDIGAGTALLAKPFTAEALGAQIRSLLDQK